MWLLLALVSGSADLVIKVNDGPEVAGISFDEAFAKAEVSPAAVVKLEVVSGLFELSTLAETWDSYFPSMTTFVLGERVKLPGGQLPSLLFAGHHSIARAVLKSSDCRAIGPQCFLGSSIRSVEAMHVTVVQSIAFYDSMIEVFDAPNLEVVGEHAFHNSRIKEVNCGNLKSVGRCGYQMCAALTVFNGTQVTEIGNYTFHKCQLLKELNLPAVVVIGELVFFECSSLIEVSLPAHASGSHVFQNCDSLEYVCFPNIEAIPSHTFENCLELRNVSAPSCKQIGDFAFVRCLSLLFIDMPLVQDIGRYCFSEALIPYKWKNNSVTKIDEGAFSNTLIESIELNSVEFIPVKCFSQCEYLASVSATSVGMLGNESFSLCKALQNIDFGREVKNISSAAFSMCCSLNNIVFPAVTHVEHSAFFECLELENMSFPNLTIVESFAFQNCVKIPNVSLPKAINLGIGAFSSGCKIKKLELPRVVSVNNSCFYLCTSLDTLSLPNVTHIGHQCFESCLALREVDLDVQTLGNRTFMNCVSLRKVCVLRLVSMGSRCFAGCNLLDNITVHDLPNCPPYAFAELPIRRIIFPQLTRVEEYTFFNCEFLTFIELSRCVEIHDYGLAGINNIRALELSVYMPYVTRIGMNGIDDVSRAQLTCLNLNYLGDYAFGTVKNVALVGNLSNLVRVGEKVLTDSVTWRGRESGLNLPKLEIGGSYMFESYSRLFEHGKIELPSLEVVGDVAFNVFHMVNISLPKLRKCGRQLFGDKCRFLREFHLPQLVETSGILLGFSDEITHIHLESLEKAGGGTFYRFQNLESLVLPKGKWLGFSCCEHCTRLTDLTIANLERIDVSCFKNCESLTNITLTSVHTMGADAFAGCTSLLEVNLPLIDTIATTCFKGCVNLSSVQIPLCTYVGNAGFRYCANLVDLNMPDLLEIGEYAFENCSSLCCLVFENISKIDQGGCRNTGIQSVSSSSLRTLSDNAFSLCRNLEYVSLNGVSSLDGMMNGHFSYCANLRVVELKGLITVSITAMDIFTGCISLEVIFLGTSPPQTFNDYVFVATGRANITFKGQSVLNITLCLPTYRDYENYEDDANKEEWKHLSARKPLHYSSVCNSPDPSQRLTIILITTGTCAGIIILAIITTILVKLKRAKNRASMVEKDLLLTRVVISDFG